MGKKVSKHKLWLAGTDGSFAESRPLTVKITEDELRIAHHLTVKLTEIAWCALRPLGRRSTFIELGVCSPSLNRGEVTPVHLIYPGFWPGTTKLKPMKAFVDDMAPRIADNQIDETIDAAAEAVENGWNEDDRIQVNYAVTASFLLVFSIWRWFDFERPWRAYIKTYFYLYFSALINSLGVLLVLLPRNNWIMSGNIELLGGSHRQRVIAFVSSMLLPPCVWAGVACLYL